MHQLVSLCKNSQIEILYTKYFILYLGRRNYILVNYGIAIRLPQDVWLVLRYSKHD